MRARFHSLVFVLLLGLVGCGTSVSQETPPTPTPAPEDAAKIERLKEHRAKLEGFRNQRKEVLEKMRSEITPATPITAAHFVTVSDVADDALDYIVSISAADQAELATELLYEATGARAALFECRAYRVLSKLEKLVVELEKAGSAASAPILKSDRSLPPELAAILGDTPEARERARVQLRKQYQDLLLTSEDTYNALLQDITDNHLLNRLYVPYRTQLVGAYEIDGNAKILLHRANTEKSLLVLAGIKNRLEALSEDLFDRMEPIRLYDRDERPAARLLVERWRDRAQKLRDGLTIALPAVHIERISDIH